MNERDKKHLEHGDWHMVTMYQWQLKEELEKARADEREACARLCVGILEPKNCDTREKSLWFEALEECAAAIRARGETK